MFFLRLGLKYVPKLIGLVGRMLAAAGKLALKLGGGALKMLGKAAPIARAALVSPAAKVIGLGAAVAGTALLANEVTGQRKAASVQAGNADRARRGKGAGVQGTDTGMDKTSSPGNIPTGTTGMLQGVRGGGLINSGNRTAGPLVTFNPTFAFSSGGAPLGTDTIPAMLSPGEFVMSKYAVKNFGVDNMKAVNDGTYSGESVYNYSINVNVKSGANPDEIARSVMTQIKQIDSQRIRGQRVS